MASSPWFSPGSINAPKHFDSGFLVFDPSLLPEGEDMEEFNLPLTPFDPVANELNNNEGNSDAEDGNKAVWDPMWHVVEDNSCDDKFTRSENNNMLPGSECSSLTLPCLTAPCVVSSATTASVRPEPKNTAATVAATARRYKPYLRQKPEPSSKKAAQVFKQRQLQQRFATSLPLLTLRPFLRNTDHALFCCLVNLTLVYVCETIRHSPFVHNHVEPHQFVAIANGSARTPKKLSKTASSPCPFPTSFCYQLMQLDKQDTIVSWYYRDADHCCYILEIDNQPMETVISFVRDALPSHCRKEQVRFHVEKLQWLNNVVCCKYFPTFNPPDGTKKKLWHAIVLLLFIANCAQKSPAQAAESICSLDATDKTALLHLFSQSLLYNALDNEQHVHSKLQALFPRQTKQHEALFAVLRTQLSLKPTLPAKKHLSNRIGKFKGRQNETTFCIVINAEIGFYVTYDQLQHKSLIQLLLQAAELPNESEFNYGDIVERLPMLLPTNKSQRLGSHFEIRTPFMSSRDPLVCFAPVMHMLWPDITCPEKLVAFNGKKWKLELEVLATDNNDVDNTAADSMEQFLQVVQFNPCSVLLTALKDWVAIVNEHNMPSGIYYYDLTKSIERATQELEHIHGLKVTMHQHPVLLGPEREGSITKIQFVRDPFHGIWSGCRTHGLAIRRHYRNKRVCMRTFLTWNDFAHEQNVNHIFLPVKQPLSSTSSIPAIIQPMQSIPVWSFGALQDYVARSCNLSQCLLIMDDIGPPQVRIIGNLPQANWHDCRFCFTANSLVEWTSLCFESATSPPPTNSELPKRNGCQFALVYGLDRRIQQDGCLSTDMLNVVHRHAQCNPHSTYFVTALRHPSIAFMDTYHQLENRVYDACLQSATKHGVKNIVTKAPTWIEVHVPKNCACCRTIHVCVIALAEALRLIHVKKPVLSVASNCSDIQGKILETEPLSLDIGLRCKHDWTNGVMCNLNLTVANSATPTTDVFICRSVPILAMPSPNTILMILT